MLRITLLTLSFVLASVPAAQAREQIRIVGSSTVYPFAAMVAETLGREGGFKTPVVESTGTGGGFKLFCGGAGESTPDIADASRPIKDSERELCAKNGVHDPFEVQIGFDGIVLADSRKGEKFSITTTQLFLGLAKKVPKGGALVENPYKRWKQIDPALPDNKIEIYGPPPTSGTRDSIVELVMDKNCKTYPEFKAAYPNEGDMKKACGLMREDGGFVEAGEDDNIIVQKLEANEKALGIFGFSFYEENADKVQAASIDGHVPTTEAIASGAYHLARSLFIYVKMEHLGSVPGIPEFLAELTSEKAMGEEGYLVMRGLVPLPEAERRQVAATVAAKAKP